jgi:hypothetical protein
MIAVRSWAECVARMVDRADSGVSGGPPPPLVLSLPTEHAFVDE